MYAKPLALPKTEASRISDERHEPSSLQPASPFQQHPGVRPFAASVPNENKMALVVGFVVGLSPGFVGFTPCMFSFFTNQPSSARKPHLHTTH